MTKWTASDGSEIEFSVYGTDAQPKTLLLLPGLLGSMSSQWHNFIRLLSPDFRIVMLDLRGHGRSQNNTPMLTLDQLLQDIKGLLDFLQIESFHIAGYDLGGYLGLMLALSQSRRVETLLMLATKFYWTQNAAAKMQSQLEPETMSTQAPAYADQLVQEHGARQWRVLVRQAGDIYVHLAENGLTDRMAAQAQCPVLVCVGDRDKLVSLDESHRLSKAIPKGELLVLPGVSHSFRTVRKIPLLPMMQYFHDLKNH
ncbi:MAG: alpha/beta fold hydrolase [Ardenticatenaceae bacterium]|nr:alpha/beta fold hydrolase [Ardenticatenaceae bacterium]MCB9446244.1 alpha/beta fold hydrolase [Ardenticatenaceae bacterium]